MVVQSRAWVGLIFGFLLSLSTVGANSVAQAQSWKPVLGDADELYDAAEDLHDRAERFHDEHTLEVTCRLEQQTTDLYQLLKRNACPADVVAALNVTGATLEEASMLVSLSCHLRSDRKAQSELANAQRYFAATVERIQCALRPTLPRPAYRAPTLQAPAPIWYQAPVPQPYSDPNVVPYGYEVRFQSAPAPRGLPRVLVQKIVQ